MLKALHQFFHGRLSLAQHNKIKLHQTEKVFRFRRDQMPAANEHMMLLGISHRARNLLHFAVLIISAAGARPDHIEVVLVKEARQVVLRIVIYILVVNRYHVAAISKR